MAKYINKSALVAEIKGYISNYKEIVAKTNRNDSTWVDSVSMIDAKIDVLQHVLFFLDNLEVKEVGVDLGDPKGDIGVKTVWDSSNSLEISQNGNSRNGDDLEEAAIKYGNCFEKHSDLASMAFIKGAKWQKEQMMKDAVYGLVCGHDESSPAWIDLNLLNKPNVKVGTEVKLIIIKDE